MQVVNESDDGKQTNIANFHKSWQSGDNNVEITLEFICKKKTPKRNERYFRMGIVEFRLF